MVLVRQRHSDLSTMPLTVTCGKGKTLLSP
jgi:hypothetical protein